MQKKIEQAIVKPVIDPDFRKLVGERIEKLSSVLGNKQVRHVWERKDTQTAVQEIKKRMKQ